MRVKAALVILAVLFTGLPFVVVHLIPTDSPEPYVFRARLAEKLGETLQGKLRYFLAEEMEGRAPARTFVVTINSAFTRMSSRLELEEGRQVWMQGSLMTPDVYYGEQYLFFGLPQVYVRQVKTGALWPDQINGLRILYLSPFTAFSSLWLMVSYPFMEEFTVAYYLLMLAQSALIVATVVYCVRRRPSGSRLALLLLSYGVIMMLTTIPMLTDLY
ncbi:MAG: hypothetical protein IBX67_05690 [Dehalococcoidia bacterium]|nr:hypothetical protein [Dehalococcoidia bacterium]